MARADLSNDLVHWIKGDCDEAVFETLYSIITQQCLRGGNETIKGSFYCVCFTEAPEKTFHQVVSKYHPVGVRVSKKWLFAQGGRHVIYESDDEYDQLPPSHRWRHMKYDPTATPRPFDFTWEREWRIQTRELQLPPGEASIIVPHQRWVDRILERHNEDEEMRIQLEMVVYGNEWQMQDPEPLQYPYSIINI